MQGDYQDPFGNPIDQPPTPAPAPPGPFPDPTAPPPTTLPPAANPWGTAPSDGNWQQWWMTNVGTNAPSLSYLQSIEPQLTGSGVKLGRNAAGAINGKVVLPNGQTVDAVRAFGSGDPSQMGWQWLTGSGGGGGGIAPFAPPTRPPLAPMPKFDAPTFKPPTVDEAINSPGYQVRELRGKDALQSWAAARGTLNDSGTAKALIDYGQNSASQEYQNVWNRDYNAFGAQYKGWADSVLNPGILDWQTRTAAQEHDYDTDYQNYWNKWRYGADTYAA